MAGRATMPDGATEAASGDGQKGKCANAVGAACAII